MGYPTLALGFQDEVWWSRLAQPSMYAWTEDKPLRLVEKEAPKADTDRKALACYGLFLPQTDTMLLRFVNGRPVSQVTCDYLAWVADRLAHDGKKALVLIWDNASWHRSKIVRQVAQSPQPARQARGRLSPDRLSTAQQESLAQPH